MRPELDPARQTPEERLRDIAAVIAAGLLRLRDRTALPTESPSHLAPEKPGKVSTQGLEVSADTSVTVHGG
jgi:hypothetical protein